MCVNKENNFVWQVLSQGDHLFCNCTRQMKNQSSMLSFFICPRSDFQTLVWVLSTKSPGLLSDFLQMLLSYSESKFFCTNLNVKNLNLVLRSDMFCAAAVRKEISDETDRMTGRGKGISPVPIHLSVYSPNGESWRTVEFFLRILPCLLNSIRSSYVKGFRWFW